jgi:poly(3-hydroxybutyrate) depolymerase
MLPCSIIAHSLAEYQKALLKAAVGRNPGQHMFYHIYDAGAAELFERTTRRYGKPAFGLETTVVDGRRCR